MPQEDDFGADGIYNPGSSIPSEARVPVPTSADIAQANEYRKAHANDKTGYEILKSYITNPGKPPAPKTPKPPEGWDKKSTPSQRISNAPKMHKGGIVPGKKGKEVLIRALAGEKVIPAMKKGIAKLGNKK